MMTGNPFPNNAWLTYAEATARWGKPTSPKQVEYILATPTALAADPAVKALVAEAEARGMERAAKRLDARIESLVADHGSHEWDTNVTNLPEWVETATEELEEQATAIRAEAAAIRKGETP